MHARVENSQAQGMPVLSSDPASCHMPHVQQVLMHIVTICEAEAAALLAATQEAADQIKEALAATQPQAEDSQDEEELKGFAQASRIDAVRAFFEEHHRRKAHAANDDPTAAKVAFDQGKRKRPLHTYMVHQCMLRVWAGTNRVQPPMPYERCSVSKLRLQGV